MNTAKHNNNTQSDTVYSTAQVWFDNAAYIATVFFGASIVWYSWNFLFSTVFVLYSAFGTLWFMVFICPHCGFHGTRACPCGYGIVSVMFVKKKDCSQFKKVFTRNVPVLFPIWFVPVYAGVYGMTRRFASGLLSLLVAFVVISFIVLPLISKKHGCLRCPNRERCPWMGKVKAAHLKGEPRWG
jgi:hypothetical protein